MTLHKEINFETEICEYLGSHGWLYSEGDTAAYDRAKALFPADLIAWVQATQPKVWETLTRSRRRSLTLSGKAVSSPPSRGMMGARVLNSPKLSPILLVRGDSGRDRPLIIADGYHRVCASYYLDENAEVICHVVDLKLCSTRVADES
jgi:hypothetical protein